MREVWNMKVVFLGVVLVGLVSLRTLGARPLVERTAADGLDFGFDQKGEDGGVLVVRGLKPGRYRLLKDGYPAGVWRADEFAMNTNNLIQQQKNHAQAEAVGEKATSSFYSGAWRTAAAESPGALKSTPA